MQFYGSQAWKRKALGRASRYLRDISYHFNEGIFLKAMYDIVQ